LCAKGRNNEQTCFGDSGGPLVYYGDPGARPVLIGVVSAGEACGTGPTKRPSQYTRVATVRDWIARHVPGAR
jgi:secreted trypsin-like serine protease